MLEIVVVAGILAFALGPLILMSRGAIGRTEHDMKRILAINLATRLVDRYASIPYPQLVELVRSGLDPESDPLLSPYTYPDGLRESLKSFTKTVSFEEQVEGRMGMLTVEVRWVPKKDAPETQLRAHRVVMSPY